MHSIVKVISPPHLDTAWKEHVHELAVDGPGAELLNLDVSGGEAVVDPGQHVVPGEVLGAGAGGVHVHCHLLVVFLSEFEVNQDFNCLVV